MAGSQRSMDGGGSVTPRPAVARAASDAQQWQRKRVHGHATHTKTTRGAWHSCAKRMNIITLQQAPTRAEGARFFSAASCKLLQLESVKVWRLQLNRAEYRAVRATNSSNSSVRRRVVDTTFARILPQSRRARHSHQGLSELRVLFTELRCARCASCRKREGSAIDVAA